MTIAGFSRATPGKTVDASELTGMSPGGATRVVSTSSTSGQFTDIQSAIDDLPSGGGCIFIREGTYTVNTAIDLSDKSNIMIIGCGRATIIKTTLTTAIYIFNIFDSTGISATGLYVKGTVGASSGVRQNGFGINRSVDCIIRGCWFDGLFSGVEINTSGGGTKSERNIISSCIANNCRIGFNIRGDISGNIISSNSTNICFTGISLSDGSDCVVSNNYVDSSTNNGIAIHLFKNANISNNMIINSTQTGINLTGSSSSDNLIIGNTIKSNDKGITIQAGTNCFVFGNTIISSTTDDIEDSGTKTKIFGNNVI
jgi:parallel beta-helix repeat protein